MNRLFIIFRLTSSISINRIYKKTNQMKGLLKQEFIIHPVGQGLFYSGKISHENKIKFRMVFDCGSNTAGACQEEIEIYRDSDFLEEKVLDLLVVSHFDKDHVNQIENLPKGGIKVKKLVMPFLTFEERLFLVLKCLDSKKILPEDDFYVRFAVDPLGTIDGNFDGDSEVFLIDSGPDEPTDSDGSPKSENDGSKGRFKFDIPGKKEIKTDEDILVLNSKVKSFKVEYSETGILSGRYLQLMEFIFYRKQVASDEKALYDEIANLFCKEFKIDLSLEKQAFLNATIEAIKKIKAAPRIKNIFREAKDKTGISAANLINLNTTALCLLHRNLPGILQLSTDPDRDSQLSFYNHNSVAYTIHKFVSSRLETPMLSPYHWHFRYYEREYPLIFPNVLLTSDAFLLKKDDLDKFLKHYESYWDDFWLFQIPHHGSEKSSNDALYSHITEVHSCFINYGIGRADHPSPSVIRSLVTTGNSSKIIPVNETLGLRFLLSL